jgi:hypothetical protein
MIGRLVGRLRRPRRQAAFVSKKSSESRGADVPETLAKTDHAPEPDSAAAAEKRAVSAATLHARAEEIQETAVSDTAPTPALEPPVSFTPVPQGHEALKISPAEPARLAEELQESGEEHATRGPAAVERTLVVGLDFGTSTTTKVVIHDLTFDRYEALSWSTALDFESVLLPSAVAIENGTLLFGNEAAACASPARLFSWFKICTLCASDPAICRRCGGASPPGEFDVADLGPIPGAAVSAAFLAFVMGAVRRRLRESYPGDQLELIWNVGCPIDRLDKLKAKQIYDAVVRVALAESETVVNGSPTSLFARLRDQLVTPPETDGALFVRPETHAAVMAFLRSPHADEMPYAIVDVGAGTTDISVFLYVQSPVLPGNPHIANYLADGTFAIGGDDIDFEIQRLRGCDLARARQLKLTSQWPNLQTVKYIVDKYQRTICRVVADRMLMGLGAYDVFLIGGGSRLLSLREALAQPPHSTIPGARSFRKIEYPRHMTGPADTAANFDVLAVAYGLASAIMDWNYLTPLEVGPLEPATAVYREHVAVDDSSPG